MNRLLGHLAQFGTFARQGELLCTQGLAFLLRRPEYERHFVDLISTASGCSVSPGLRWLAEPYQADGGRPDLEGRSPQGRPVVKVEAKLGAELGARQLQSYLTDLSVAGADQKGVLVLLVPHARRQQIAAHLGDYLGVSGESPWHVTRGTKPLSVTVIGWEDVFQVLGKASPSDAEDDLAQLHAMYRVLNGDDMQPLTSDEEVLAWRDREAWWETLVDLVTRRLSDPDHPILPFGSEEGTQPYRRRYVCRERRKGSTCYSIGIRDPFKHHRTPIWLRFNSSTGRFAEINARIRRSSLEGAAIRSQGKVWFPLEVPLNSSREVMIEALVKQVEGILAIAYAEGIPGLEVGSR